MAMNKGNKNKEKLYQDTIGSRLGVVRKAIGVNIDIFSAVIDIPVNALEKYESGDSSPSAEVIQSTAKAGINGHWLLTGHGPMLIKDLYISENKPKRNDPENVSLNSEYLEQYKAKTQQVLDLFPGDDVAAWAALTIELAFAYGVSESAIERIIEVSQALKNHKK